MNPVHIVTEKKNIAPLVLLPGDPLRAKYIAENFLDNPRLINTVRNMYGFTGKYKGKEITVMGSGMGCPSVGIYAYELYHFYDVEKIIRIGTSGSLNPDLNLLDVVVGLGCYSESSFAYHWGKYTDKYIEANKKLTTNIIATAKEYGKDIKYGPIFTSDVFDVYAPIDHILDNCPIKDKLMCAEMEGFGLLHVARIENKEAAIMTTIVDSKYRDNVVTPEDREKSLNKMIKIALDTIIK